MRRARGARASLCCLSSTDVCQALSAAPSPRVEPQQLATERRQLCRLRRPHFFGRARVRHFQRRPVVAPAWQPLPPHHDAPQTLLLVGRRRLRRDVRRLTTCSRHVLRPEREEHDRGEGVRTLGADGVAGTCGAISGPVPELSGPHRDRLTDPRLLARVQRVAVPAQTQSSLSLSEAQYARRASVLRVARQVGVPEHKSTRGCGDVIDRPVRVVFDGRDGQRAVTRLLRDPRVEALVKA